MLVLLATAAMLAEAGSLVDRAMASARVLWACVAGVLAVSVVSALALYPVALWLVVGVLLVVAFASTVWWLLGRSWSPLVLAALFMTFALVVSLHAAWLTAAALAVCLAGTLLVHLRSRSSTLAAGTGAALAAALAGAAWTAGHLLDADPSWVALAGLLGLGALVLAQPYAPGRWWVCDDPAFARTGLEAGSAAAALPLAAVGVLLAPSAYDATWAAGYLTAAGVVVTADVAASRGPPPARLARRGAARARQLGAPRRPRRRGAGGVHAAIGARPGGGRHRAPAPEPHRQHDDGALTRPVAWRWFPACCGCSLTRSACGRSCSGSALWRWCWLGLRVRWTAPVALGAVAGALLVLRLAAPYIGDALPRWVLIGGAGALLIGVGATWEHRLTDARHLMTYVRALR